MKTENMTGTATQKLFYEDSYIKEFSGIVLRCTEGKRGYEVVLDRTAFYPEGGGQPGDTGVLICENQTVDVLDTREKENQIIHITKVPISEGSNVTGRIDWERRFDFMQNHSGEHIVSGLIHERFGYANVGFHMGKDSTTIDFDGEFTVLDMQEIEQKANAFVWGNDEAIIRFYTQEEVKSVEYRSKKELHGMVRIVSFPGADVCACCGTHVKRTGEIGLIKLISAEKFKGGIRMEMLCGRKALEYVRMVCMQNGRISVALSAKPLQTADAVQRNKEALAKAQYRVVELENQTFEMIAKSQAGSEGCVLFEENLSSDGVRRLAALLIEKNSGVCMVFSGDEKQGYKYAIGQKDGDLREFVKNLNQALQGRGGGKPFFAQGSVAAGKEQILNWLCQDKP